MNFEERKRYLLATGEWWFDAWWQEDKWYENMPFCKEEFLARVEYLKRHFPADWIMSQAEEILFHPFIQYFFWGQGSSQIRNIWYFAERTASIASFEGFSSVLRAYKSIEQAKSANLEMFSAYIFALRSLNVKFIRSGSKKGKTPDLLVSSKTGEFTVECKSLEDSEAELWVDNYGREFGNILSREQPEVYEMIFNGNGREINPKDYGYPNLLDYKEAAKCDLASTVNFLNGVNEKSGDNLIFDAGSIGEVTLIRKEGEQNYVIDIPDIQRAFIGARLAGNALKEASEQIKRFGKPGIVAIYYNHPPEFEYTADGLPGLFERFYEEHRFTMGVLIFQAQNLLQYMPPFWIENPYSDYDPNEFGIPDIFVDTLKPLR